MALAKLAPGSLAPQEPCLAECVSGREEGECGVAKGFPAREAEARGVALCEKGKETQFPADPRGWGVRISGL